MADEQYITLSLSTLCAMGLMERDPQFLKAGTRFEAEIRETCWHALFNKRPDQLQQWLADIGDQGLQERHRYHLNECRAWLWLTLYNRHFINLQLNTLQLAERQEMIEHLNRLRQQHKAFQQRNPQPERAPQ